MPEPRSFVSHFFIKALAPGVDRAATLQNEYLGGNCSFCCNSLLFYENLLPNVKATWLLCIFMLLVVSPCRYVQFRENFRLIEKSVAETNTLPRLHYIGTVLIRYKLQVVAEEEGKRC